MVSFLPAFSFSLFSCTRNASRSVMSASSWLVTCGIITQLRCRLAALIFLMRAIGLRSTGPNLAKSTLGHGSRPSASPPPPAGAFPAAALVRTSPAITCLVKPWTPSCVMRPLGPVPLTSSSGTPSSRANLRTDGDACGRLPLGAVGSCGGSAAVGAWRSATGAGAGAASARWGEGWGEGLAAPAAPCPSTIAIRSPMLTLSPTLTFISLSTPAAEDGISIDALSDSMVRSDCSCLIVSPGLASSSITATSLKSPMSGTRTSMRLASPLPSAAGAGAGAGEAAERAWGLAPSPFWAEGWGEGLAAPAAAASTVAITEPSETLSPILTLSSFTTPAVEDGISIEALSDSTVSSDCSCLIVSPGLTSSSMTAMSLKSPMSGTFTSTRAMFLVLRGPDAGLLVVVGATSGVQRIHLVGLDAVAVDGLGHLRHRQRAFLGQRLERRHGNVMAVDLEVFAQLAAEVAAAEAIGAQHLVRASLGDEGADLVDVLLDVVGGSHHGAVVLLELLRHEGHARSRGRVQHVVALAVQAVARQLVEAGAAPHVRLHAPVLRQQLLRGQRLAQDGAAAQELHAQLAGATGLAQVHALDDLLLGAGLQAGHRVVLVQQGDVVEDVLLLLHHALEAVVHDHPDFVREGRVVAAAVRNGLRDDVAVAVLMLQALAVQRGPARGAAQQEAARLHVARRPHQVAHALQAEHRVVDVERDHDAVAGAVRRRRRNPAGHAARLVDAFLQDLPRRVFLVVGDLVAVLRGVLLPLVVVDADGAEQAFHAEGARLVHQDRHRARADLLVTQQLRQKAHVGLRRGDLAPFRRRFGHRLESLQRGHVQLLVRLGTAARQVAAQR